MGRLLMQKRWHVHSQAPRRIGWKVGQQTVGRGNERSGSRDVWTIDLVNA